MKWLRQLAVIVMVLSLFLGATVQPGKAAALPPQCSGFQLQNTSAANAATISVQFYTIGADTGVAAYSFNLPDLLANSSKSYYLPTYAGFSTVTPGSYSIVIASSESLLTLVNQNTCSGSSPYILASYAGAAGSDIGKTVYVSYVLSRAYAALWSSTIVAQNTGATDTSVSIDFFAPGNATPVQNFTKTVKGGESWSIDLSTGTYATVALNNFKGSAKLTSNTNDIAVVEVHYPNSVTTLSATNGKPDTFGSQKLFAPQVVKNYGGFTSGLTVINPNATATDIAIEYIKAGETTATYTQNATIGANGTFIQYLGNAPTSTNLPASFNGTAVIRVTSAGTNKIFGNADMASAAMADSLNMIPVEKGATTLYMPQITHSYSGFNSGWQVVNTSANALTLSVEYWKPTDTTTPTLTETWPLAANSVISNYVGKPAYDATLGVGFNGGVVIKVTAGTGTIVGQANFVGGSGDAFSMFGAFPPPQ
jgi:hypothetical protein